MRDIWNTNGIHRQGLFILLENKRDEKIIVRIHSVVLFSHAQQAENRAGENKNLDAWWDSRIILAF